MGFDIIYFLGALILITVHDLRHIGQALPHQSDRPHRRLA